MMKLNNLTIFEDFKKMYEAADTGTEFSNTTGLKESLLGRGIFGLFRMIKKGINAVRLEYFKRRLENEYLAGLLRYCKKNNIDLKNPQALSKGSTTKVEKTAEESAIENEMKDLLNDILLIKFDTPEYEKILTEIKNEIDKNINEVSTFNLDENDKKMIEQFREVIKIIDYILIICKNFNDLKTAGSYNASFITNIIDSVRSIKGSELIKSFELNYIASESEKSLLDTYKAQKEVIDLLAELNIKSEPVVAENYKILNEKVGSNPVGVDFILGDELSVDGVGEFLNKQGVNSVDDINFVQLASIFDEKMKENATKHVNQNGILRIQFGVSPIVYHVTPTRDDRGMNPGEGGGVDTTKPTNLMKTWQMKVQKIMGEFSPFLNVNSLDPLRMDMKNYNTSEDRGNKKLNEEFEKSEEIKRLGIIEKYKNDIKVKRPITDFGMIRLFTGNKYHGLIFKMDSKDEKIYRYLGCVDLDMITKDIDTKKSVDVTVIQKSETIFPTVPDSPIFLNKMMKEHQKSKSGKLLVGVYFMFEKSFTNLSSGEHQSNSTKILFVYYKTNDNTKTTFYNKNFTSDAFEIYYLNEDSLDITQLDLNNTSLDSIKLIKNIAVGETFEFLDGCQMKTDFTNTMKSMEDIKLLKLPGIIIKNK